jgi:hypothetical protein
MRPVLIVKVSPAVAVCIVVMWSGAPSSSALIEISIVASTLEASWGWAASVLPVRRRAIRRSRISVVVSVSTVNRGPLRIITRRHGVGVIYPSFNDLAVLGH